MYRCFILEGDPSQDSVVELFNMTPESVAIVFLFFHFDRVFADLNAPFFFQVRSLSQDFTLEAVGKSVLSHYGKVTISNQCCEIFLPCRKLCSTNQNQSALRLPQGLLWALKRAKPCRGRALQVPGMEANRIPVTRGTNGCLWQIRSGHRDRCTNQTLTVPVWGC